MLISWSIESHFVFSYVWNNLDSIVSISQSTDRLTLKQLLWVFRLLSVPRSFARCCWVSWLRGSENCFADTQLSSTQRNKYQPMREQNWNKMTNLKPENWTHYHLFFRHLTLSRNNQSTHFPNAKSCFSDKNQCFWSKLTHNSIFKVNCNIVLILFTLTTNFTSIV